MIFLQVFSDMHLSFLLMSHKSPPCKYLVMAVLADDVIVSIVLVDAIYFDNVRVIHGFEELEFVDCLGSRLLGCVGGLADYLDCA